MKGKARSTLKPNKKKLHTRAQCLSLAQKLSKLKWKLEHGRIWCISCGVPLELGEARCQGGHYISSSDRATETEPDNINPQCSSCNCLKYGNIPAYRYQLVRIIGEERVNRLDYMSMARKGSEEALEKLSPEDRVKALMKKSARYYDNLWYELNEQIKEAERELGL